MNEHSMHPLTREQSDFAAEQYRLIFSFLSERDINTEEAYDAVLFSFLWAAQNYCEHPKLRKMAFPEVATQYMDKALSKYLAKQARRTAAHACAA